MTPYPSHAKQSFCEASKIHKLFRVIALVAESGDGKWVRIEHSATKTSDYVLYSQGACLVGG